MQRRDFLKLGAAVGAGLVARSAGATDDRTEPTAGGGASTGAAGPVVISTWKFGEAANGVASSILQVGGSPLDAVENGVAVVESDPKTQSVGYGGLPNADGKVELDAAIMDGANLECGAVLGMEGIKNPVKVARRVMTETPHVILTGAGAQTFAVSQGFTVENLLTPEAEKAWKKWKASGKKDPEGHDTIGQIALDRHGRMAASCTTSGMAWKIPGRVGDSPIVGAGLYCDEKAGGAVATGVGEEIIKICGSFLIVELMRAGRTPQEAVDEALRRVVARDPKNAKAQVAFCALRNDGLVGYGTTVGPFHAVVTRGGKTEVIEAPVFRAKK